MEDSRHRIAAVEIVDHRSKGLLNGVTVELEDLRCRSLLSRAAIEIDDHRCKHTATKTEDPRCVNLHKIW